MSVKNVETAKKVSHLIGASGTVVAVESMPPAAPMSFQKRPYQTKGINLAAGTNPVPDAFSEQWARCPLIQAGDVAGNFYDFHENAGFSEGGDIVRVAPELVAKVAGLYASTCGKKVPTLFHGRPPTALFYGGALDLLAAKLVAPIRLGPGVKLCAHPLHSKQATNKQRVPVESSDASLPLQVFGGVMCSECYDASDFRRVAPPISIAGAGWLSVDPFFARIADERLKENFGFLKELKEQNVVAGALGVGLTDACKLISRAPEGVLTDRWPDSGGKRSLRLSARIGRFSTKGLAIVKASAVNHRTVSGILASCAGGAKVGTSVLWRNGAVAINVRPQLGSRNKVIGQGHHSLYRMIGSGFIGENNLVEVISRIVAATECLVTIMITGRPQPSEVYNCARDIGPVGGDGLCCGEQASWAQVLSAMRVKPAVIRGMLKPSICDESCTGTFGILAELASMGYIGVRLAESHELLPEEIGEGDIERSVIEQAWINGASPGLPQYGSPPVLRLDVNQLRAAI